jgi:hypothetical protein
MLHRRLALLLMVPSLAVAPCVASAQRLERTPEHPTPEQVEAQLRYQTGHVTVRAAAFLRKLFGRKPADAAAKL